MDQFRFTLKDYHAVKKADIKLDGITVLAGLNGCGKSTIARWIYGFVRYSNEFDTIIEEAVSSAIKARTRRIAEVQRRLAYMSRSHAISGEVGPTEDLKESAGRFMQRVYALADTLLGMGNTTTPGRDRQVYNWIRNNLDMEQKDTLMETVEDWKRKEEDWLDIQLSRCECEKNTRNIGRLFRIIGDNLDIKGPLPHDIQYYEAGIPLLDFTYSEHDGDAIPLYEGFHDTALEPQALYAGEQEGRFETPIGLKRAIYINSPLAFTNHWGVGEPIHSGLRKMFVTPLKSMSDQGREIAVALSTELGGDIVLRDNEMTSAEIRYVRTSDGLDIAIDDISTGMKAFAYLLRLLENGYLDSETLLIIDEPEAHLHPQWIFNFARILVMLNKRLGVKLLLASHNPDMVAAMQTIGVTEGLESELNFYQAKRQLGEEEYTYQPLGSDISEIFKCFNIAMERIDGYRPSNS